MLRKYLIKLLIKPQLEHCNNESHNELVRYRKAVKSQHMLTMPKQINLWLKISHLPHVSIIYFFATLQCMIIEMFGIFCCALNPFETVKDEETTTDQDSHAAYLLMSLLRSGYE